MMTLSSDCLHGIYAFLCINILHTIPLTAADYMEVRVDLPLQPVLFMFQVRPCCERCSRSMSRRLLCLCHGSPCDTNFSEFYGKYLQESLEVHTAVLPKFQVLWGVTPCC